MFFNYILFLIIKLDFKFIRVNKLKLGFIIINNVLPS